MTSTDANADAEDDAPGANDPRRVSTVAVTVDDAVTALEAVRRSDRPVVLRATPPFAGRMRARLHVEGSEGRYGDDGDAEPIHLSPERLVRADAPPYPEVDATEDALREGDATYSTATHRDRHVAEVEAWREAVRDHLADAVTLDVDGEPHRVEVAWLG